MKTRITRSNPANSSIAIVMAFAVGQAISSLSAAPLTWDSDANSVNGVNDGSGTWDTTTNEWYNGASDVAWDNLNNDTAIFGNGGTGGSGTSTVTLGTGITVGGLTFNTSSTTANYNIVGGGNTLTFGGTTNPVTITANANATIDASLAVSGSVTTLRKTGSAILELSGGGTVPRIETGPSSGSVFVTDGTFALGALNFYDTGRGNDNTTNGKVFQTGGTVTISQDWDGRNDSSSYNITGGTLTANPANRIRGLGTFNAGGDAVVNFTTDDPRIASDGSSGTLSINGNASFTHSGSYAQLNLVNSGNAVSGTINLGGGTLTVLGIRNGSTTGSGFVNFNGGTLKVNPLIVFKGSFFEASILNTASVYGGGAIVDSNGKDVTISQPLLATTGNGIDIITVSAGGSGYTTAPSITFSGGGGTGATGYALIDTSGRVTSIVITNPGSDYTSAPTVVFGSGSATATATAALVNGNGGFTKNGAGTLTLSGANTFTGDTVINSGTLKPVNALVLQYSTLDYNNQGGTLDLSYGATTLGGIKGVQDLALAGTTLSIGNNNASNIYSGILSNGSLVKIGTGTQTLSGASTYSGGTTVSGGALLVNNTSGSGTGSGTVGVSPGNTLGGSGIIGGATTLTTATLAPGSAAATVGTATFGAGLALNTSSIFEWDMRQTATSDPGGAPAPGGTNPGSYDKAVLTGAANSLTGTDGIFKIVLGGDKSFADEFWNTDKVWNDVFTGTGMTGVNLASIFSTFNANGTNLTGGVVTGEGTFGWGGGNTLTWSAVPEPTSAMAGLLLGFGLLRRRR